MLGAPYMPFCAVASARREEPGRDLLVWGVGRLSPTLYSSILSCFLTHPHINLFHGWETEKKVWPEIGYKTFENI